MDQLVPIADCAIIVSDQDNVAVAKRPIEAGTLVAMKDGRSLTITGPVSPGHRFATSPVPAGQFLLQYGHPIGTSLGVQEGDPISFVNLTNDGTFERCLHQALNTSATD